MIRAVYAFVVQGFRQQSAYRVEGWMGMISGLIWFVMFAGVWTALLRNDPEALRRQMQYVIASRFLSELLLLPTWEVAAKFRQGDIGLELIKPIALWTVQFDEADQIYFTLQQLFSGSFIPLHFLPPAVASVAMVLPFAGVVYVPSAILSGTLQGMALQVLWSAVGAAVLSGMWRIGSRKLVVQGG